MQPQCITHLHCVASPVSRETNKHMQVANTWAFWTEKKINYIYLLNNSQFYGGWDSLDVGYVAAQEFPTSLHDCGLQSGPEHPFPCLTQLALGCPRNTSPVTGFVLQNTAVKKGSRSLERINPAKLRGRPGPRFHGTVTQKTVLQQSFCLSCLASTSCLLPMPCGAHLGCPVIDHELFGHKNIFCSGFTELSTAEPWHTQLKLP